MLAAVALFSLGLVVLLDATGALDRAELSSVDRRFEIRGARAVPDDVVVVGIDDVTFNELKERWQFGRRTFARALNGVAADKPKVIVYDVQFTEQSDDADADEALAQATLDAGNVVLSTTEVGPRGEHAVFGGKKFTDIVKARVGNGLLPEGSSGALRRVPYEIDKLKTLSVVAVERATGKPVDRSKMRGDGAWIDYSGPPGHVRVRLVLGRRQAHLQARHLPQQDRGDRRDRAVAAGPPPHLVARRRDGRPGDPRERDRHAAARLPAARVERDHRPADRARPRAAADPARDLAAAVRGARDRAGGGGAVRGDRAGRVRPRADPARSSCR